MASTSSCVHASYRRRLSNRQELSSGGWDADCNWLAVIGCDRPELRKLFEIEVFRFLGERELLSVERMELIRSW